MRLEDGSEIVRRRGNVDGGSAMHKPAFTREDKDEQFSRTTGEWSSHSRHGDQRKDTYDESQDTDETNSWNTMAGI